MWRMSLRRELEGVMLKEARVRVKLGSLSWRDIWAFTHDEKLLDKLPKTIERVNSISSVHLLCM